MTINDVIARADSIRPNAVPVEQKVKMLLNLENDVAERMHVRPDPDKKPAKLLMPAPRDEMYVWYLCAMIDLVQEETDLYMNDMGIANGMTDEAFKWINRTQRKRRWNPFRVM